MDKSEFEVRSTTSRSSRASATSVALAAAQARAKAEAAQARAAFAKKEIEVKLEKARLEATLHALHIEGEAQAAAAEAAVMEAAAASLETIAEPPINLGQTQRASERTAEYVAKHSNPCDEEPIKMNEKDIKKKENTHERQTDGSDMDLKEYLLQRAPEIIDSKSEWNEPKKQDNQSFTPNAQEKMAHNNPHYMTPSTGRSQYWPTAQHYSSDTNELAKYLVKSQLLVSELDKFDDKPENYLSWKSSFISGTEHLDLKVGEEIDLLIKSLGPESARHARRIKAVNISKSAVALRLIWERLEETYGSPEAIEGALFAKLDQFPKIGPRDNIKLRELSDLLLEINSAKEEGYLNGLSYLDTARGIGPIVEKLPYGLQDRWMMEGSRYKQENEVGFPPFTVFIQFIQTQAKARNDPSFNIQSLSIGGMKKDRLVENQSNNRRTVSVHKTNITSSPASEPDKWCPVHNKPHALLQCRGFKEKTLDEKRRLLKQHNVCYKCCASNKHVARNCEAAVKCSECQSDKHPTVMHSDAPYRPTQSVAPADYGGEEEDGKEQRVVTSCTEVCEEGFTGKSCSKICLVNVYPANDRSKSKRLYAMLDDQSNLSLARSEFFDMFKVNSSPIPYTLQTCAGVGLTAGRRALGYVIEPVDGAPAIPLPMLIECNMIPNKREEIPTPAAAQGHPHLERIAHKIPPIDDNAQILLLLGRDILQVHKVRSQINGPHNAPYAQRLDLGWVIVGDVCLGSTHKPSRVTSLKTHVLANGRPTHFTPCGNHFNVKTELSLPVRPPIPSNTNVKQSGAGTGLEDDVFCQTKNDNKLAPSMEDLSFLKIMDDEFKQDENKSWVAPLPFRRPRKILPNNRQYAVSRLKSLQRTLKKNPEMQSHFIDFMQKMLDNGHAEVAPPVQENKEYWYLPFFGVYHPQKPSQIRVVFDSNARFEGMSLNDVLLSGPNLNNSLLGVLLRFRKHQVAITADIQQMFYCFLVREDCRDVLRFVWHEDNNPKNQIVDFRMRVHVFGNSPSPAVATFGLRRAAQQGEEKYGEDVRQFVDRDFYVDDALKSVPTEEDAIDLLKRTQDMLAESNLRLLKMASNKVKVMDAFPVKDRAKDLQDLDLSEDDLPDQRSLGVKWNIMSDEFTFHIPQTDKPYTRRGVLSTVNGVFDPLGFLSPVIIQGRLLLRELSPYATEWDSALPESMRGKWTEWQQSLQCLSDLQIPRTYSNISLSQAKIVELCIFSDASLKAICAVAYLKVTDADDAVEVGFVLGKARLAPQPELTVPRLELCAAVMAVEMAEVISEEIDHQIDKISFYTDSKVVLGYISNQSRRFYVYVSNRVRRIRESTTPEQWHFVPTDKNPADHGSRSVPASELQNTTWLTGPAFLKCSSDIQPQPHKYELMDPDGDAEVRPQVETFYTCSSKTVLDTKRWERFSSWKSLIRTVANLIHIADCFSLQKTKKDCTGWHMCSTAITCELMGKAENTIIKNVQQETYTEEIKCIGTKLNLPKHSSLIKLNPFIGNDGLLRVGGRIARSGLETKETNPIILPGTHHITTLLVRHQHEKVSHQGRHFTEGAVRESGLWIVGAKRCIAKVINKCVTCKKLRGRFEEQLMSDLPSERLQVEPPFSYVGMDVFGPWEVVTRRTRGGQANSKRWAVLFTCLSTRAVHIEVVEEMSSSSFINALRRFFALRGPAKQLRSDCGTNFTGAHKEITASSPLKDEVQHYLKEQRCKWVFNPPHSSHMGGVWERMIGIARRILDSMLLQAGSVQLTHEILTTFLAEVTAIMNARPLVPVSTDPEHPLILCPAMLLTQKTHAVPPICDNISQKEMLKSHWKRVQLLADNFWNRWRKEYLSSLQSRQKWHHKRTDIKEGDVVLLKEKQTRRNEWPMGVIVKTVPSEDGITRKAEVKVANQETVKTYYRPISEMVFLLSGDV
nr:uncharacterized protein LOC129163443 [Nothobranchius furzeri]